MERTYETPAWLKAAEVKLVYKTTVKASERPTVKSSKHAYDIFLQHWDPGMLELCEQFKVMFLNRGNKVLGIFELATGGISTVVADPKLIFSAALKANACNILICHSHPSGALKPSTPDIELTKKLVAAGKFLDLNVLDHLIITTENYYSFADEGLL